MAHLGTDQNRKNEEVCLDLVKVLSIAILRKMKVGKVIQGILAFFVIAHTGDLAAQPEGMRTDSSSPRRLPPITMECIYQRSIYDWKALDRYNLLVWAPSRNHPYHVELDNACFELRWANTIAFYSRGFDDRICGFGGDKIIVGGRFPEHCSIGAIHKLTPDSAQELIEAFRSVRRGEHEGKETEDEME